MKEPHPGHPLFFGRLKIVSIEIVFYPNSATKKALCDYLIESSFHPSKHLWDWPNGSRHFFWFDEDDHQSFVGVEATVYPISEIEREEYPDAKWALHTRTRAFASFWDIDQQNNIVRQFRRRFGGNFENDAHGKNRYTPTIPDSRDEVARGFFLSYRSVTEKISNIRFALPEPLENLGQLTGTRFDSLSRTDPTRVLYNALVPFVVAIFEHFFSGCFQILLKYDEPAQKRLVEKNRRMDDADVLAVLSSKKTFESVIARRYSFQSISAINTAFKEIHNIDFRSIMRQRKRIGSRLPILERQLEQLIELRHGIVHGMNLDFDLRRKDIDELLDLVTVIMDAFIEHVEKKKGISIRAR